MEINHFSVQKQNISFIIRCTMYIYSDHIFQHVLISNLNSTKAYRIVCNIFFWVHCWPYFSLAKSKSLVWRGKCLLRGMYAHKYSSDTIVSQWHLLLDFLPSAQYNSEWRYCLFILGLRFECLFFWLFILILLVIG